MVKMSLVARIYERRIGPHQRIFLSRSYEKRSRNNEALLVCRSYAYDGPFIIRNICENYDYS